MARADPKKLHAESLVLGCIDMLVRGERIEDGGNHAVVDGRLARRFSPLSRCIAWLLRYPSLMN